MKDNKNMAAAGWIVAGILAIAAGWGWVRDTQARKAIDDAGMQIDAATGKLVKKTA